MSSRKLRRIILLALVLSSGVCAIPDAEAAQARGRTGPSIQHALYLRTLMQNIMDTLRAVAVPKWNPGPPGGVENPPPSSNPNEGAGMCPNGGGPLPGPGQ